MVTSIVWPVTLPDAPLLDGYSEQMPDYQLRTQQGTGVDKVRPKASAVPWPMTVQMVMTSAQVDTLKTFYTTTLSRGCLRFQFTDARANTVVECRFKGSPKFTPVQNRWTASFTLEVMP